MIIVRRMFHAAAALAVLACSHDTSVKGTGPYADKVAKIVPKLEQQIGLKFKTLPKLEIRTRDEVKNFLEKKFTEEMPAGELAASERVYKRFGLLPDTVNLSKLLLALLSEQVIGYYDPQPKVLYVVQGSADDMVEPIIAHELVHALQDQYVNLDSLQKEHDDNDRATAAQSVMEGQATLEGFAAMIGGENFVTRLPGGWDRVRQMIRDAQSSMPVFAAAPMLLQETLIFPYLSGAEYARRFKDRNPGKSPFEHMPVSTEQILHEDAFFGATPDMPVTLTLPRPTAGKLVYENDLGEFETRLLLFQWVGDQATSVRGAAGWDGDRYQLIDTNGGEALVWLTVWDTTIDAAEFFSDMDVGIVRQFSARQQGGGETVHTYTGRGRTLTITISQLNGRTVVVYTDVPQGSSPNVIDLSKVTLKE